MTVAEEYAEPPAALGIVLDEGRGHLPYSLIHGEALVACAAWALGAAGVTPLDAGIAWSSVRTADEPLVLHDSLCPMTPAEFIAECVARALAEDAVVAAVRPVTDTIKRLDGDAVGGTVDREALLAPASPVVLPPSVVRSLAEPPGSDLPRLLARLHSSGVSVVSVVAPAQARRVATREDLQVLAAVTAPD